MKEPVEPLYPDDQIAEPQHNGRGALSNATSRYDDEKRIRTTDGWDIEDELPPLRTTLTKDATRTILARNTSPDIPFDRSINPYRGCEHGCIYCFARPTHAYLGLSPGLDFETKILFKPEAAALLTAELASPKYRCDVVAMGTNTDPYQPVERDLKITRQILRVLSDFNNPVGIVTKNHLITRDIDILGDMARRNLAEVFLSITTLDRDLARTMEPRASAPHRRLAAIRELSAAGIPVGVMTAPMIPGLNDHEMEAILDAAAAAGATRAGYTALRLPLEIKDLFEEWLRANRPDRAERVLSLVRQMRDGELYKAEFGTRMKGEGPIAQLLSQRFAASVKRLDLNRVRYRLDTMRFAVPAAARTALVDARRDARQMRLF
ncbi:PA0069 family radical SAM protein [Reyranella sp. MMS21-HV4-11]|uniref:PA0069 family radical SAM protein n=1 Tax=Reyranella humidisoli TaxID=2849149 RepID=A0ABS6ICT6_9HYPH|nr:PA0069 family radical SAM protein [Reyranella sp. MMS21-HV4-11]MBU8872422.1 PA0069 family radical SAM protein [Reyranella sp. MMS21-HV4-11]